MAAPRQTATPLARSPKSPSNLKPRASTARYSNWAPSPSATASVAVSAASLAAEQADGFVFGSPVYYAHPSGRILSALDRAFYAGSKAFVHKPGAAVAVARRGGTSTTFDVLNKYFTINQMPVVASTYWNNVFGAMPGEAAQDAEGLATMRNIGKNMAWLLHCIEAGQAAGIEAPEADRERTNFIR